MARVSVIIPTHSRPELLPRAVESARAAGKDVEVVVVDDASTDATAEVCRRLENIRYVRADRNQRVAGARNLGILASTSEYISFLDDDDWRLPGSLDAQLELLEAAPEAGVVYGQMLLADQEGNVLDKPPEPAECPEGDVFWQLLERDFLGCLTAVFRKSCLLRVGLLDHTIPGIDDWDLWVRIAELYPFVALKRPVAVWRLPTRASGQGLSDATALFARACRRQRERWLALPRAAGAPPRKRRELGRRLRETTANMAIWDAADTLSAGAYGGAASKLATAFRFSPASTLKPHTFKLMTLRLFARARAAGAPGK